MADDFGSNATGWVPSQSPCPHSLIEHASKHLVRGPFAPTGDRSGVAWSLDISGGALSFVDNWAEYPDPAVIEVGEWIHVAGTWDGNDIRLYLDGVEVAFGENVFSAAPNTSTR